MQPSFFFFQSLCTYTPNENSNVHAVSTQGPPHEIKSSNGERKLLCYWFWNGIWALWVILTLPFRYVHVIPSCGWNIAGSSSTSVSGLC